MCAIVAAEIGGKVDILVNNAEYLPPPTHQQSLGVDTAAPEMDGQLLSACCASRRIRSAMRGRARMAWRAPRRG